MVFTTTPVLLPPMIPKPSPVPSLTRVITSTWVQSVFNCQQTHHTTPVTLLHDCRWEAWWSRTSAVVPAWHSHSSPSPMPTGLLFYITTWAHNTLCPKKTVTTLPWEIQKVIFQQYYSETSDYYIISEETNCNCCTAAYLFTYCCLLLPIICVALFYGQFFISLVSHFQSHQCQPTTGSFQSHQHLEVRDIICSQM